MDVDKIEQELATELPHVYRWEDAPGKVYEEHAHKGRVVLCVVQGSIAMVVGGEEFSLGTGDRCEVPVGVLHSAVVGSGGVGFVVGEEIEGDS